MPTASHQADLNKLGLLVVELFQIRSFFCAPILDYAFEFSMEMKV